MSNIDITIDTATPPANRPIQIYAYTGQQLKIALEKHYNVLRSKILSVKLHTQRISNLVLIKNTALNALTFGQYAKLFNHQKTLKNDPVEQDKYRQLIRDIEHKYTQPPHITTLCKEIKAHEGICSILIECNKNTLASLESKAAATLIEKRKLDGHEQKLFKALSDKIVDLPNDALYQSHFLNIKEHKR